MPKPVYQLIYPNAPLGYQLFQLTAVGMIFAALNQTINGSLQGLGKVSVPAKALLCGVVLKVTLNNILIRIPAVNIYGAAIGSVVCYLTACTMCFAQLRRSLNLTLPASRYLWKPLFCTGIIAVTAECTYAFSMRLFHSNAFSILLTVMIAVAVYFALVFYCRILTKEDVQQIPFGTYRRRKRSKNLLE